MSDFAATVGSGREPIVRPARGTRRRTMSNIFIGVMIALVLLWTLFPFYWSLMNSFKYAQDNYGNKWIPWLQFKPTLDPWRVLWDEREVKKSLINSTIISVGAATVATEPALGPDPGCPDTRTSAGKRGVTANR